MASLKAMAVILFGPNLTCTSRKTVSSSLLLGLFDFLRVYNGKLSTLLPERQTVWGKHRCNCKGSLYATNVRFVFLHGIVLSQAALAKLLSCGFILSQVPSAVRCTCLHTTKKCVFPCIPKDRNKSPSHLQNIYSSVSPPCKWRKAVKVVEARLTLGPLLGHKPVKKK